MGASSVALSTAKTAAVFAAPVAGSKSMPFALMAPEAWLAAPEAVCVALPTSSLATGPAVRSTYLTPASATGRAASTARLTTGDATSAALPATSAALPTASAATLMAFSTLSAALSMESKMEKSSCDGSCSRVRCACVRAWGAGKKRSEGERATRTTRTREEELFTPTTKNVSSGLIHPLSDATRRRDGQAPFPPCQVAGRKR